MPTTSYYPVFEPDQVLTDEQLNASFAYLDRQDQLTRNKLIGIGIACGLHCSPGTGTITITKGVGVTSLGMLIHMDGGVYSHFRPYQLKDFPESIDPAVHASYAGWGMKELIPLTQPKQGGDLALGSNAALLKTHAVVLFLEPLLTDLKNCTTDDCNDKGRRVDFTVRPLLVPEALLQSYRTGPLQQSGLTFPEVHLRRWNVPAQHMQHPANVIQAFDDILNAKLIGELDAACRFIYTLFHPLLGNGEDDAILNGVYKMLSSLAQQTRSSNPVHYQYVYDFVDDLCKACTEFRDAAFESLSACCPDESLFPLHLVLGEADVSSADHGTALRSYFIHSPLFSGRREQEAELQLLYRRLLRMLNGFELPRTAAEASRLPIRITPSHLGAGPLGQRCIPYYYDYGAIHTFWDHLKTRRGRATANHGYFAGQFGDESVAQPLLYDTEPFNFFRIEGHAGKPAAAALREIAAQRQRFNLPFDVVALNLYQHASLAAADKVKCYFNDLESAYNVLLSGLLCKLHGLYCAAGKMQFNERIFDLLYRGKNNNAFAESATNSTFGTHAAGAAAAAAGDDKEEQPDLNGLNFGRTYVKGFEESMEVVNSIVAASYVDRMRGINPYRKGSYMTAFCKPGDKDATVARYYLNWLAANPGKTWPKPQPPVAGDTNLMSWWATAYAHYFYLIDLVEELLEVLLPYNLHEVPYAKTNQRYDALMAEVEAYADYFENFLFGLEILQAQVDKNNNKSFDPVVEDQQDWAIQKLLGKLVADSRGLIMMCFDEQLRQLQAEYRKRARKILEQHIFSGYAKLKPGLEHKAGVPKGGTFVLLYFDRGGETPREQPTIVNAAAAGTTVAEGSRLRLNRDGTAAAMAGAGKGASDGEKLQDYIAGIRKTAEWNKQAFEIAEWSQLETVLGKIGSLSAAPETLRIPSGVVFADLYIPYLCCSDCAPTAFVFQDTKEEGPDPELTIEGRSFCNNDDTMVPLRVSPEGGKVSGPGTSQDGAAFFFCAYGLSAGNYTLTYSLDNGASASAAVTVLDTPDQEWTYAENGNNPAGAPGVGVSFTAAYPGGTHSWDFGDGSAPSTLPNPEHTYLVPNGQRRVEVSHSVSNGACALPPVTKTIELRLSNPVALSIGRPQLCSNDGPQALEYSPAGGTMTVAGKPGAIVQMTGRFFFAPALAGAGKHSITYSTASGSKSFEVEVTEAASADFTAEIVKSSRSSVDVQFTSVTQKGTHRWDFKDGQQSAAANPLMTFQRSVTAPDQPMEVRHVLDSEPCRDVRVKQVPLAASGSIENRDLQVCFTKDPLPLEPNITAKDKFELLDGGGQQVDDQGRLQLDPKATYKESFTVQYRFTPAGGAGVEKHVRVIVTRPDTRVTVSFDKSTVVLQAASPGATWTVAAQNSSDPKKATVIVDSKSENPLRLSGTQLPQAVEVALLLTVTVTEDKCSETHHFSIPASTYNPWIKGGTGMLDLGNSTAGGQIVKGDVRRKGSQSIKDVRKLRKDNTGEDQQ